MDEARLRWRGPLQAAEQKLQPLRAELLAATELSIQETRPDDRAFRNLQTLLALLRADYGRGLRGLMLLPSHESLPDKVASKLLELKNEFDAHSKRLRSEHNDLRTELNQVLAPKRQELLQRGSFAELAAIDYRLQKESFWITSIRVFARRTPRVGAMEAAELCDVDNDRYAIRYVVDQSLSWLPRSEIIFDRIEVKDANAELWLPNDKTYSALDNAGKARPAVETFDFDIGQEIQALYGKDWHNVVVEDVSPFGVLIRWEDMGKQNMQLLPRNRVREIAKAE